MSWWKSIVDPSDLVECPDCPRPGRVPRKEMTNHIAILHKGEAFRCAVCKVCDWYGLISYLYILNLT